MGVRIDAPGRVMADYHTAMRIVRADGTLDKDNTKNTATSLRYYLSDARFLVGLESGDMSFLADIDDALLHPVWPLYLGRKSFCPAVPVRLPDGSLREGVGLEEALTGFPWCRGRQWEEKPDRLRLVLEPREGRGSATLMDRPVDFASRRFELRDVLTDFVSTSGLPDGGVLPCTCPG
jgi:CRISPR system Cascade subunit CasD